MQPHALPAGRRTCAVFAGCCGLLVASATLLPAVADFDADLRRGTWWLLQAALGAIALACGVAAGRVRAAALAALLLLATTAQLELTAPMWLQVLDLRPSHLFSGSHLAAGAVLLLQAIVVIPMAVARRRAVAGIVREIRAPRTAVVLGGLFLLTAAHASLLFRAERPVPPAAYGALLVAAAGLWALHAANLVLFVAAVPREDVDRAVAAVRARFSVPGADGAPEPGDRWLPGVLAAWTVAFGVAVALGVFDGVPHIPDEVSFLFQARCLASGTVTAPAPPVPEAFTSYMIDVRDGRWFGTANPGWPAVLALGVAAGVPWIVNPLLGGLCVLLFHAVARRASDRGTANAATTLLAVSPWFLFLGGTLMSHTLSLALLLGAWRLLLPDGGPRRPIATAGAGALLGALVAVRPLDGVAAGAVTGLWLLVAERRRVASVVLPFALGCVGGSLGFLAHNLRLTGKVSLDPFNTYVDRLWYPGANRLGFGADVGNVAGGWGGLDPLPGHGPADVLLNAQQNVFGVNVELFGWLTGSLLLAAIHLARGRPSPLDRRMGAFALAVAGAYSLYWFSGGPDFGARYWFLAIVPCLWMSVRGAVTLADSLREQAATAAAGARVAVAVATLSAISLATFVPWRVATRYVDYRGFHDGYVRLARHGGLGRSLVLVRSTETADAGSALAVNPPTLDPEGPLFARDLGPESEERLRAAYPDRPVVHVLGRSITGGDPRVARPAR